MLRPSLAGLFVSYREWIFTRHWNNLMVVCGVYEHMLEAKPGGHVAGLLKKMAFWTKHHPA